MTPLPQRWAPSVAADGRSGGTSTWMPMMDGATRSMCDGSTDTRLGSGFGAPPCGATPRIAGRARRATATARTERRMVSSPGTILFFVVRAEGSRLDRLPPRFVLLVPRHGCLESGAEGVGWLPAESADLARVERVATVVARPIRHRRDETLGLAQEVQHLPSQHDVFHLVAAADIVNLAVLALAERQVDGRAVVENVEPVPHVLPVAVERQGLVFDRIGDEERDDLFRVLVRAEVVAAARDDHGQAVRRPERFREEIRRGLGGRVGIGR